MQLVASRMTLPAADPKNDDPNMRIQRQMAYFLPLISILYGGALPAGLFIYWIAATLIQIVQQYLILGWGGMFPLFGWLPGFAAEPHPAVPGQAPGAQAHPFPVNQRARRSAREPSIGTFRPIDRSGPTDSGAAAEGDDADMSEYQEFTGKSVEEAIKAACDAFGVGLGDLDFEILTPGSRGVLGMGAEPARIVAAPRSALGGAAPKREAAESKPLPPPPAREDRGPREYGDRPPPPGDRRTATGGPRRDDRPAGERPATATARRVDRGPRRDDRPPPRDRRPRPAPRRPPAPAPARPAPSRGGSELSAAEVAAVTTARGSLAMERAELEAAEATPEALAAGKEILETVMGHLGFDDVTVEIREGETSRLNVVGDGADREALGSLIGRKGERLSALQHLVNLMLSRRTGQWTRVLVDVEDYRGRRERQLVDLAEPRRRARRRDRQDAPAGADAGPRAPLDPPRAAGPRRRLHPVDRRGAESPRRRAAADLGPNPNRLGEPRRTPQGRLSAKTRPDGSSSVPSKRRLLRSPSAWTETDCP